MTLKLCPFTRPLGPIVSCVEVLSGRQLARGSDYVVIHKGEKRYEPESPGP